jgi:hypothetical protein
MNPKSLPQLFKAADQLSDNVYDQTTVILAHYGPKAANEIVPSDTLTGTLQISPLQFANIATEINTTFGTSFTDGDVGVCPTVSDLVTSISHAILKTRSHARALAASQHTLPGATVRSARGKASTSSKKRSSTPKRNSRKNG